MWSHRLVFLPKLEVHSLYETGEKTTRFSVSIGLVFFLVYRLANV